MASRNIVQTALTHVVRSVFASLFDKNILLLIIMVIMMMMMIIIIIIIVMIIIMTLFRC